ncbi:MAG: hypothetical protein U5R30_16760 [Deltaproteobacteria bacterium]|nr:hypothetical protein [Deltaproteobacteria bacterium]
MVPCRKNIVVATDETVYFFTPDNFGPPARPIEFSLAEMTSRSPNEPLPPHHGKNGAGVLLVVPDLWFKHEFFAFQSPKESLISAFLERKLRSAYPHLPQVDRFFTFRLKRKSAEERGVNVIFLQDEKGYLLHDFLVKAKLTPRWITTPALLWAERLRQIEPDFSRQGILLANLREERILLHFFFEGQLLFSRHLTLPDGSDRWDTLLFEINQSIYLYAQKTKSALNKICAAGDAAALKEQLSEKLDIPISFLEAGKAESALPRNLAFLQGVWTPEGVGTPSEVNSITDKNTRRELMWKPVQWCGIIAAVVSILLLAGENLWLERLLQNKLKSQTELMERRSYDPADIEMALAAVSEHARRMPSVYALARIDAAMPDSVRIDEVKIDPDNSSIELAATVSVDQIDRFRLTIHTLADNLNRQLNLSRAITMEDIVFQMDDVTKPSEKTNYRISLKAVMP